MSAVSQGVPFARYDEDGRYFTTGIVQAGSSTLNEPGVYAGLVDPETQYHDPAGFPVDMPPRPSGSYSFNFKRKFWELDQDALWAEVRRRRNGLIAATDWTQLPDVSPEVQLAWRQYRQALRDVTTQPDPTAIIWPTPP